MTPAEQLLMDIFGAADDVIRKAKKTRGRKHYENLIAYQKRKSAPRTRPSDYSGYVQTGDFLKPNHAARVCTMEAMYAVRERAKKKPFVPMDELLDYLFKRPKKEAS